MESFVSKSIDATSGKTQTSERYKVRTLSKLDENEKEEEEEEKEEMNEDEGVKRTKMIWIKRIPEKNRPLCYISNRIERLQKQNKVEEQNMKRRSVYSMERRGK